MKILFPTDFSEVSKNALFWTVNFLGLFESSEIILLHCIENLNEGFKYKNTDTIKDQRISLMQNLCERVNQSIDLFGINSKINPQIYKANSKDFIHEFAYTNKVDCIILGSNGLNITKDLTFGSVTESIVEKSTIPVMIIPKNTPISDFSEVVIGVDPTEIKMLNQMKPLFKFLELFNPQPNLHFVTVVKENETTKDRSCISENYSTYECNHYCIPMTENISKSLNTHANDLNAGMVVLIHKKRNIIGEMIHQSIFKEELYQLELPMLVVPFEG